jgi:hypothetical protein
MSRRGGGPTAAPSTALVALAALATAPLAMGGCGGGGAPPAEPRRVTRVVPPDEDGEGQGLDVASSRGVLEPEQIRATVDPHGAALSACYLGHAKGRRWLGGALQLRWEVGADGGVVQAHVAESDLGAWPVERCLLEVARKLVFPAPRGGAATDFVLPLEFSATGSAARWDELQSAAAVGALLPELDACSPDFIDGVVAAGQPPAAPAKPVAKPAPARPAPAKPAPAAAPADAPPAAAVVDPGGAESPRDVLITLYAGPRGQVQSVGFAVSGPEGLADRWAACAEKIALGWKVAGARGAATKLTVRYVGAPAPAPLQP